MLKVRPSPRSDLPQLPRLPCLHAVLSTPADRTGAFRFLPHPCCLPRITGGSASTIVLSRPARASLALRPASSQPAYSGPCPEAPTRPVAQPSRSVATMSTDNYMGGSSLHWKSAPLGRTVIAYNCAATRTRAMRVPAQIVRCCAFSRAGNRLLRRLSCCAERVRHVCRNMTVCARLKHSGPCTSITHGPFRSLGKLVDAFASSLAVCKR